MYSGIDQPDRWVLPQVLAEQAAATPDAPWVITTEGDGLSFGQAHADAQRVAGFFAGLGVKPGDRVAVMLPNGCDFIRAWLGLSSMGAVVVLLNTELRGAFLRHQLQNSGVALAVVHSTMLNSIAEVASEAPDLRQVVVTELPADGGDVPLNLIDWSNWQRASPFEGRAPQAHDIAAIMYTSGTSGPAKGVLMPHAHCALYGIGTIKAVALTSADRYYVTLPLFHANGLLMQLGATLLAAIPAVLRTRFSASAWLDDVRQHRATVSNLLGATATFVVDQPARANDRDHQLRALLNAPNLASAEAAFRSRFAVRDVISGFGMTECNIAVWGRVGQPAPGAAGWTHTEHFDVMIADPQTDAVLPAGQVGEILIRPKIPFGFMQGYHGMPDQTVEAWRNLWFHSGDAGTMAPDGLITFVDRIKDCIRRRGENISASEVEALVASIPGVGEIAAFAVASDIAGGEDELMLAVVRAGESSITAAEIGARTDTLLPRFARPRYIEFLDELPKTATGKVQRAMLRKRGSKNALDRDVVAPRASSNVR